MREKKGLGLLWDAVLGMTIAAGVFTRFTYLFFFMPVGLAYLLFHSRSGLWPAQRTLSLAATTTHTSARSLELAGPHHRNAAGHWFVGRAVAMFGRLWVMLAGFLALSFLLVVLDSLYFGTLTLSLHGSVQLYLTVSCVLFCHHPSFSRASCAVCVCGVWCACAVVGQVVPWHGLAAVLSRPAEWAHVAFAGTLTLTPWNSLRYNMQVDNLSTRA